MKALEVGEVVEQITARIKEKNEERKELEKQLALESAALVNLTIPQVKFFLTHLRDGIADDIDYRKTLLTVLVNAIYLYDDKLTLILNVGDKTIEINEELLDEIEENTSSVRLSTNKVHHGRPKSIDLGFFVVFIRLEALVRASKHRLRRSRCKARVPDAFKKSLRKCGLSF